MAGYEVVNPPGGMSYGAPLVDFSTIGDLANTFMQGRTSAFQNRANQRAEDIATAFPNGIPMVNGQPDYAAMMKILAQKGGVDQAIRLAPTQADAALRAQASQLSPLLAGASAAPQTAVPSPAAAAPQSTPAQPVSFPAPAANPSPGRGDQAGSVVDIVTGALPQDSGTTGAVISNIARAVGVDPNAALTPQQSARVTQLVGAYARRTGVAPQPQATPAAAAPQSPNDRVAATFALQGAPGGPQATSPGPASAPAPLPAAPQPAPTQVPAAAAQPIIPQVPLPRGFAPGQEQQAIQALRSEAVRIAGDTNPYHARQVAEQVKELNAWADKIEASMQPIKIGQSDTFLNPRTGQIVAQGPAAAAFGARGPSQTLDADAERYRQTGTLPPNMGRGVQGQAEAQAIRTRASEMELAEGGNPANWPRRWQEYRAAGVGLSTEARTTATRESNLNMILKVTSAAIPAALELSDKVARTGWVPLNKIIQGGEVIASNPDLKRFGMANLQLAEHWARAMNPTGVMREGDRDLALGFLSTADSPETYRAAVMQLKTQIERERDSIREQRGEKPVAAPGAREAPARSGDQGWVTLPSGVRYREKPAQQ